MSEEKCENCGKLIGSLQTALVWNNHVVCEQCSKELQRKGTSPAAQISPPQLQHYSGQNTVIFATTLHPAAVFGGIVVFACSIILLPLAVLLLPFAILRYKAWKFELTSQRIIISRGLISRHTQELMLRNIESVNLSQGIFGRMIDSGTLIVTGTGNSVQKFRQIRSPVILRDRTIEAMATAK